MKKIIVLITISIALMASFSGCQKDDVTPGTPLSIITLDKACVGLFIGDRETLIASVYPEKATITWTSSNSNIASISTEGVISAKAAGTTTITAIIDGSGSSATCEVTVAASKYGLWGLGNHLTEERSNNVNYEWYIDQGNTGTHSKVNCGPACVTMAIKWSNPNFTKTTEDARNRYHPNGGWWYTSDITNYLNDNHTSHYVSSLANTTSLINQLKDGNIAILCLDIYYVRYHTKAPEWRVDKFYSTTSPKSGHFIVVKGYKIVDGQIWFEVYDPWSLNVRYQDGSLKGRNRYYRSEDIIKATNVWWEYMIVVNNPANPVAHSKQAIDPATIIHQWGR